jgi:hypothetical protein
MDMDTDMLGCWDMLRFRSLNAFLSLLAGLLNLHAVR